MTMSDSFSSELEAAMRGGRSQSPVCPVDHTGAAACSVCGWEKYAGPLPGLSEVFENIEDVQDYLNDATIPVDQIDFDIEAYLESVKKDIARLQAHAIAGWTESKKAHTQAMVAWIVATTFILVSGVLLIALVA
jgi:hypothetical protein